MTMFSAFLLSAVIAAKRGQFFRIHSYGENLERITTGTNLIQNRFLSFVKFVQSVS